MLFRTLRRRLYPRARRRAGRQGSGSFRPRLEFLEDRMLLATWINPAGGFWHVGSNWNTGAPPGPGEDAIIDVPGNVTITHNQGTDVIRSLQSQKAIDLAGGSLMLNQD